MNYLTTKQKEYSKGGIPQAPSMKDGQTNGGYVVYRDNLADEDGVIDLLRDDIYYDSSTGGAVRVEKIQPQKATAEPELFFFMISSKMFTLSSGRSE